MKNFRSYRQEVCVTGFEQNAQKLAGLIRQKQANRESNEPDAAKFSFEMKSYHSVDGSLLATQYSSNIENGLSDETAADRLIRDGPNHIQPPKQLSTWTKFIMAIFSGFSPLLWIAAILAFISWQPLGPEFTYYYSLIIGVVLVVVIILSNLFNFVQERRVLHILSELAIRDQNPTCTVVRSGVHIIVDANQLVIGDIVILETGLRVPADLRVVTCDELKVDTSLLTGEVVPVKLIADPVPEYVSYLEAANTVFLGSTVMQGSGRGMVIATGGRTQIAKITQECSRVPAPTAVQRELQFIITAISACTSIAVLAALLFWVIYLRVVQTSYSAISNLFVDLITLVIAIVPICLPLAVSVGTTLLARRLSSRYKVLVKRLGNVLTLGAVSMLACDKTGTLTQNKAAVSVILSSINLKSEDTAEESKLYDIPYSAHIIEASYRIASLGNQAKLKLETTEVRQAQPYDIGPDLECGSSTSDVYSAVGSKSTARALLGWVNSQTDITDIMNTFEVQTTLPFCPVAKISASVVCDKITLEATVMVKGAPEWLLPQCTHFMNAGGVSVPMTDTTRFGLAALIHREEERGSSVIVLAQRGPLPFSQFPRDYKYKIDPQPNFPLDALTFVSCAAIVDPLAEDALETVRQLRAAGVLVAMITGDAAITAVAVARECGIVVNGTQMKQINTVQTLHRQMGAAYDHTVSILVLGVDVDGMTAVEWDFVFAHKEIVFARTSPDQKLGIVKECQRRNHVVGVMGDGVNDCPALAAADIGIVVNSGADVAREIAEVLLLNDSFFGVVHGVREGRLMFDNMRKMVAYLLSVSFWAQLLPTLVSFFLGLPKPMTIFNIILICCLTDVFGALALMYESPESGMMERPPRNIHTHHLIDARLVWYSLFYGSLEAVGGFFNYFAYFAHHGNTTVNELGQKGQLGYRPRDLLFLWYKLAPNTFTFVPEEVVTVWEGASSVYFAALVVAQMFHLLSIRRKVPYLFNHHLISRMSTTTSAGDSRNQLFSVLRELCCTAWVQWHVLYALVGSVALSVFFMYISIFNKYCRTAAIPIPFWGLAVAWGLLWFALAEARKWIVALYPGSWVDRALVW